MNKTINTLIISSDQNFIKHSIEELAKNNFKIYFILENQINLFNDKNEVISEKNIIKKTIEENHIEQIILDLNPPHSLPYNFNQKQLQELEQFIFKFHQMNHEIIKSLTNKKLKILCLVKYDKNDFWMNRIVNNYMLAYYQGLRIETKPYDSKLNVIFNETNDNKISNLLAVLKGQPKQLATCIKKADYKRHIINKNKIFLNQKIKPSKNQKNKVAIVTGASGGIGWEIAKLLNQNGWKVYSLSRQEKYGDGIKFIKCNLYDEDDIKQKVALVYQKEKRFDMLVNNSGYGISGSLENTNYNDFVKMFKLNAIAPIKVIWAVLPYINKSRGTIFTIGSMAGVFSIPFQAAYSLTKIFVDLTTELLAKDLNERHISICNIMPGDTKTNFSKNRQVANFANEGEYAKRIQTSIAKMEKDEKHGHDPKKIAKLIIKNEKKAQMPIKVAEGAKYKFLYFLAKHLTPLMIENLLYEIYAK